MDITDDELVPTVIEEEIVVQDVPAAKIVKSTGKKIPVQATTQDNFSPPVPAIIDDPIITAPNPLQNQVSQNTEIVMKDSEDNSDPMEDIIIGSQSTSSVQGRTQSLGGANVRPETSQNPANQNLEVPARSLESEPMDTVPDSYPTGTTPSRTKRRFQPTVPKTRRFKKSRVNLLRLK
jgi:hypothetical protein